MVLDLKQLLDKKCCFVWTTLWKKNHKKSKSLFLEESLNNKKEILHEQPYTLDLDLDPNIQLPFCNQIAVLDVLEEMSGILSYIHRKTKFTWKALSLRAFHSNLIRMEKKTQKTKTRMFFQICCPAEYLEKHILPH